MRHDARPRSTFVRQLDEPEILGVEQAGVKRHLGHCPSYARQGECHGPFVLSAPHLGIDDVVVHRIEAQESRGHLAVERERRPVARRRAERVAVGGTVGRFKQHEIVGQALGVSAEPEAETRRHGHLQVGISGHQDVAEALALSLQLANKGHDVFGHVANSVAGEEFEIKEDLIVA